MSVRKTMYVKENSFRKLDDPFNDFTKKYVFYVKVCDVPEGIPMATNPRDQKLTSGVAQAIKESLESNDGFFSSKKQRNCSFCKELYIQQQNQRSNDQFY